MMFETILDQFRPVKLLSNSVVGFQRVHGAKCLVVVCQVRQLSVFDCSNTITNTNIITNRPSSRNIVHT